MENTKVNTQRLVYACEDYEKNYIKFFFKKEDAEKYIIDNPRKYACITMHTVKDGDTIAILAEY